MGIEVKVCCEDGLDDYVRFVADREDCTYEGAIKTILMKSWEKEIPEDFPAKQEKLIISIFDGNPGDIVEITLDQLRTLYWNGVTTGQNDDWQESPGIDVVSYYPAIEPWGA